MVVDFRRLAVPFKAAKHRGAGDLQFLAALHDRFVQGFPVVPLAFAKMETKEFGFLNRSHAKTPLAGGCEPGESPPRRKKQ
jgi:predicted deacetylase